MLEFDAKIANVVGRFDEGAPDIVVADDAEFERHAAFHSVAHGCGNAGIGDGDDDIRIDVAFARELGADAFAGLVDGHAFEHGIRAGEIDVFEDAEACGVGAEGFHAVHAAMIDDDDFAGIHVPHEFGTDDVQRAGFADEHPGRICAGQVDAAENQGAHAKGVSHADQGFVGQGDERIGADDLFERVDQAVHDSGIEADCDEVDEDFAIHR